MTPDSKLFRFLQEKIRLIRLKDRTYSSEKKIINGTDRRSKGLREYFSGTNSNRSQLFAFPSLETAMGHLVKQSEASTFSVFPGKILEKYFPTIRPIGLQLERSFVRISERYILEKVRMEFDFAF
ncbi:hypothetical protein LEP1GSC047_3619 [Leptospira inadai serovar Lyme str. 10]|uniref:Uncharacterized protein n=2 Tax=Leptospira inadai serovar Lyme TaxID=293084 RepID=V6HE58_9LEPT|nr:hypothetical protein LEP1GSC047_3619 [Leptospira inadai serovar Lyme str. 10]PNV74974.1 hypothetical protein BES34_010395 [Leptospira inadai serovar Lyme]